MFINIDFICFSQHTLWESKFSHFFPWKLKSIFPFENSLMLVGENSFHLLNWPTLGALYENLLTITFYCSFFLFLDFQHEIYRLYLSWREERVLHCNGDKASFAESWVFILNTYCVIMAIEWQSNLLQWKASEMKMKQKWIMVDNISPNNKNSKII